MSNVIPLGVTHDPGCNCRRCLNAAYVSAKTRVADTTSRYQATRTAGAPAALISQARQRWTEARQELILAEHALRTAEDDARIEARENRRADALRWNPKGAL